MSLKCGITFYTTGCVYECDSRVCVYVYVGVTVT